VKCTPVSFMRNQPRSSSTYIITSTKNKIISSLLLFIAFGNVKTSQPCNTPDTINRKHPPLPYDVLHLDCYLVFHVYGSVTSPSGSISPRYLKRQELSDSKHKLETLCRGTTADDTGTLNNSMSVQQHRIQRYVHI
jgi:hypothetical protein